MVLTSVTMGVSFDSLLLNASLVLSIYLIWYQDH